MKNLLSFLLAAACILALAACGSTPPPVDEAPMPGSDPPSDDPSPAKEVTVTAPVTECIAIPESPPGLTVLRIDTEISAMHCSSTWEYLNADGTTTCLCACGLHPLECREYMTPLVLIPSHLSHIDPKAGYLRFDISPDEVSMRRWSALDWGKTDAESTDVPVSIANDGGAPLYVLQLEDGDFVYEVTAHWDFNGSFGGSCSYCFCTTMPKLRSENFS